MKTLLTSCLLLLGVVSSIAADAIAIYPITRVYITNGMSTNIVAAVTAVNPRVPFPVTQGQFAAIQVNYKLTGAGTSNNYFSFDASVDGTNAWATNLYVIGVAANGTTNVGGVSNWNIGAFGYLRIGTITNNNGTAMTNIVIRSGQKPGI